VTPSLSQNPTPCDLAPTHGRRSKDLHGFAEWGEGMMKPLELPAWFKNLEHVGGWAMQLAESAGVPRATWEPLIQAGQGVSKAVGGAAMDVADLIRGQPEVVQWSLLPGHFKRPYRLLTMH
jgi:hypothetical protein